MSILSYVAGRSDAAPREVAAFQPSRSNVQFLSWTTLIALFAAVSIAAYLVAHYALHVPATQARWVLIAVLVVGGAPLLIGLARNLFDGQFGSDLLAGMSILTSAVLGQYLVSSIVALMLSGGTALEEYATRRVLPFWARSQRECPRIAHRKRTDQLLDVFDNQRRLFIAVDVEARLFTAHLDFTGANGCRT